MDKYSIKNEPFVSFKNKLNLYEENILVIVLAFFRIF